MESPFKVDIVKGKVALITGGGSGIGFEITKELGKHGASVAIMGRRKSVLDSAVSSLRSLGIQAIGFQGDVRNQEDATRVVDATFEHFGRIDILVNAAAGNFLVPAEDLSPNGFKTVMEIDTVGTFGMCHEALKYIKKGGPGRDTSGAKHINGAILVVDGGDWFNRAPHVSREAVKKMSRTVEKRSRANATAPESGVPTRSKM
ncbi:hypothetical protein MKX03_035873 [Papaver bracteatum]|nr:hypothetical protein MKX03_035873 [Papaver bracteatum]